MHLEDREKRELLRVARLSIEADLGGGSAHENVEPSPAMRELRGVFVTLRDENDLRGCIGYIEPHLPLLEAVKEVAVKAATEDPRFFPLTQDDLAAVRIEISVLSGLSTIKDPSSIEIGIHGLVIDAGVTRGLLLPGVAVEHRWNSEEFLRHTALKAGLPPEIWRSGNVHISTFTTETFSESELLELN